MELMRLWKILLCAQMRPYRTNLFKGRLKDFHMHKCIFQTECFITHSPFTLAMAADDYVRSSICKLGVLGGERDADVWALSH